MSGAIGIPAVGRHSESSLAGPIVSAYRIPQIPPAFLTPTGRFAFQMTDASNALEGAAVLINDGTVYGPNDGIIPSGMPSNNTYVLPIGGNFFHVYLVITVDQPSGLLTSCSIAQSATTPDDSGGTFYITIGVVPVDYSSTVPRCLPINFVCGDVFIQVLPTTGLDEGKFWQWAFDPSDGNQKWFEGLTVSDGATTLANVNEIDVDGSLFTVSDGGGGSANVTLKTTDCG